jgi:large subunit ribosomal protein L32
LLCAILVFKYNNKIARAILSKIFERILFLNERISKNINIMAVPKKRTSKTKKNIRKSVWKNQINQQALKALSIGKSLLKKTFTEESDSDKGFRKTE